MEWLENAHTTSVWLSLDREMHEAVHREEALGPKLQEERIDELVGIFCEILKRLDDIEE